MATTPHSCGPIAAGGGGSASFERFGWQIICGPDYTCVGFNLEGTPLPKTDDNWAYFNEYGDPDIKEQRRVLAVLPHSIVALTDVTLVGPPDMLRLSHSFSSESDFCTDNGSDDGVHA